MNFSTVQRVLQTIRAGDEVEWTRGENRVKINNAANGVPPLTQDVAKNLNIKINVNWGEMMVLLANARRQYLSAFWSTPYFFKIDIPLAPPEFQSEWGAALTELINGKMRNSLSYFELHRSRWAQVCTHGIGPMRWRKSEGWLPKCVAIEDVRIPTDTTLDFDDNLGWFALRHIYTPYELIKQAFDDHPSAKQWDRKAIAAILKNYKEMNFDFAPNHYEWETTPEKFAELIKQDGGYYASDAMPGIPLWHFYFQDDTEDGNEGWWMRIVPETGYVKGSAVTDKFLWESAQPIAPAWKQILQCQFGDLSNKAPFLYHSVRSLGFILLDPTFYTNLTRCRMLQHIHDNFNVWLRITDPPDKARALMQEFANMKVLRTGVNIVPQTERHQIDAELVDSGMAQLKQLMNEASSTYTQQTDTGTKKEQTAFETSVKVQQVNAMMSGLLLTSFIYAKQEYIEICRRFCVKSTKPDPDVFDVQQSAHKLGIPDKWMDHHLWNVEPMSPIGMGNPSLAEAKMQQLMQFRPAYDETAQKEILHEATIVLTGDPRKAARWVPLGKDKPMSDSVRDAQAVFGTLMQGVLIPPRDGLSDVEQIDTLLPLMAGVISRMERRDNVGTPDEVQGLQTVAEYIGGLIQRIAPDKAKQQFVKQAGDALGKLMNQVKGLAQRGEQQRQQAGQGQDPQAMAKAQATMMQAQAKVQGKAMEGRQKLRQKRQEHTLEQRRKDAETYAEIGRKAALTRADEHAQKIKAFNSGNGNSGE
jgi:hypothetical protein